MTKSEALQKLNYFESDLFLKKLGEFDSTILLIPYRDLVEDSLKGECNQLYRDDEDHFLYKLMSWRQDLQEFAKAIQKIGDINNWTGRRKRFDYIIRNFTPEAIQYLENNFLWF